MKLSAVRITNFRSVEDSGEVNLDQVTCLVGKNESGKTAILTGLCALNPYVAEHATLDKERDYPRRFLTDYSERHEGAAAQVVWTKWTLDADDHDALREILGATADKLATVVVTRAYGQSVPNVAVAVAEREVVEHLLETSGLHSEERDGLAASASVAELRAGLDAVGASASERHNALKARLAQSFPDNSAEEAARRVLEARLPKFLYFSQYERMPGQVALEELQRRRNENRLTEGDRIFLAFCDLVGAPLDAIVSIKKFEPLLARFEAASNKISGEIFRYWSQNRHLKVQFRRDIAEPGDAPPFNSGPIFRTRIFNQLHEVTVPFDERSAGFVWFFSFLVYFSQVKRTHGENLVILLDEPGLSLHAKAQADLLRYFKERLAPNHQVVYSTHSPFMVPADDLLSVRTVEDVVVSQGEGELPEIKGTKVGSDIVGVDRDTLFPLQGALGYEITQSLFIGENTLLVEGPSDLVYLKTFSDHLKAGGRTHLDGRWTICPVGGVDKVAAFMSLFGANHLNVVTLVDVGAGQKRKVEELDRLTRVLQRGRVLTAASYAGQAEADIEDIIGGEAYLDIVNDCYGFTGKDAISLPTSRAPGRITKLVEEVMRPRASAPPYDHLPPALHLMENRKLLSKLTGLSDALARFEQLFVDVNALLAK